MLVVPVAGSALFLALFAQANPLIDDTFTAIRFPDLWDILCRLLFSVPFLLLTWSSLRPRGTCLRPAWLAGIRRRRSAPAACDADPVSGRVQPDLCGAERPRPRLSVERRAVAPGVTLADYAHRGAYP